MCIFCKIVSREIPSHIIYEDDAVMAILDISQVTKGHTLVLSKKHYDDYMDCPVETLSKIMNVAQIVTQRINDRLHPHGFNLLSNLGAAAGQSVDHVHFHLIPRYDESDALTIAFHPSNKTDQMETTAKILKEK